jgi:aldehyde:ferredoxin oxidoreductase
VYGGLSKYGTSDCIDVTSELGIFPAMNFSRTGEFAPVQRVGSEAQARDTVRHVACHNCPVACSQVRTARDGPYAGVLTEGPEFESSWVFSGATGVDYLPALYAADRLCDDLGLDTMSAGMTIAWAMEACERGLLSRAETGGLELGFGNYEAMLDLLHQMAYRQGFGAVLADGAVRAAEQVGRGSDAFVMHVKGLELPGYDVRGAKAHGLNYGTTYVGADHNRGYAAQEIFGSTIPVAVDRLSTEHAAALCKWNQDMKMALCDCPTFCAFLLTAGAILDPAPQGIGEEDTQARVGTVAEMLASATGLPFTAEGLVRVGERANALGRAFNAREGFARKDDYLPTRMADEPLAAGASRGQRTSRPDQDRMLDEYYELNGYDQNGIPTRQRLVDLGLQDVADALAETRLRLL